MPMGTAILTALLTARYLFRVMGVWRPAAQAGFAMYITWYGTWYGANFWAKNF